MQRFLRIPWLGLVAAVSAAQPAIAQDRSPPSWYFGPLVGYVLPDSGRDADYAYNGLLVLGFRVSDAFSVELNGFGQTTRRESDGGDNYSYGGGLDLAFGAPQPGHLLFLLGGGAIYEDNKGQTSTSGYANLGLGAYLPFAFGRELWRVEARYNAIFNDTAVTDEDVLQDVRLNVGILFGFGHKMLAPPPVEPPAPVPPAATLDDEDGDGVPDALDECPGTPRWVRADERGCTPDDDGDGVANDRDRCPGTPAGTPVDAEGCPLRPEPKPDPAADDDGDGVPNVRDQCPHTPPGYAVDEHGCLKVEEVVLSNIHFELSSDALTAEGFRILHGLASSLKQMPTTVVEVAGHADSSGSPGFNHELSQRRAAVVRDFLVYLGAPPERLLAVGHGDTRPIADNATEEGRARNRRVEFRVLYR